MSEQVPGGGIELSLAEVEALDARWSSCWTPGEVAQHGIPYLAPELVLLFKAKHARPKDQSDFDQTIPHMTPAQRTALARLLARAHPGHRWLADL